MTISEIKNLTKFLTDNDIQKIKEEIKSKETVLKSGNLEEEEIIQVLNTLFSILVIEKTLELEIEDIEEIRDELQDELSSTTDALASTTDALTEYRTENASLTDAYENLKVDVTLLQEDTTEEDTEDVNDEIKSLTKSVNDDTIVEATAEVEDKEKVEVIPFESDEVESYEPDNLGRTYLGTYQLTAYEWTGSPCANGNYPTTNYTVAFNSLPLGTKIYIEGYGDYVVEDRGGMGNNVIDVYMGDYSACIQFGRRSANVYIYE